MRGEMQKQMDLALQKLFESKSDAFTTKEIRNFVRMVMLGRFWRRDSKSVLASFKIKPI